MLIVFQNIEIQFSLFKSAILQKRRLNAYQYNKLS